MRISTSMLHTNALNAMMRQQANLAKTNDQMSSMKKIQKPSDDPVASVRILKLEQTKASQEQYGSSITAVTTRLDLEEQAMNDAESALQRISELAVKANNSSLSQSDREAIATELQQLRDEMMDIANRKDANDEYLFSGLSTSTKPFSNDAAGVASYSGSAVVRNVQVSSSQYVSDGNAGDQVFMSVPEGNGTFVMAATAANTGSGVITGNVVNLANWIPDDYSLTFTSATSWQITDSSSNVVSSGSYTDGSAIAFNGIEVSVTGTPASGDSFAINTSAQQDVFTTIDSLITSLQSSLSTDADKAGFQNQMNQIIQQLDQTETHFLSVLTSVGARSAMLDNTESARQDSMLQLETSLSGLQDADYTELAITYSKQYTALQAAQQSYAKISKLSLFDYL